MKTKFYHIFLMAVGIFIAISLFPKKADALLAPDYDFSTAVVKADLIVRGRVIETRSEWVEGSYGRNIFTYVLMQVDIAIKGDQRSEYIEFRVKGGTVGDITQIVSDFASFIPAEKAIVLLSSPQGGRGILEVLPGYGKIPVIEEKVSWAGSIITAEDFVEALNTFIENPDYNRNQLLELYLDQRVPSIQDQAEMIEVDPSAPPVRAEEMEDQGRIQALEREYLSIDQAGSPDLKPCKLKSWDDTMVISNVKDTNTTASKIYDDETVYVDYACENSGDGAAGHFRMGLYIDGTRVKSADITSLAARRAVFVPDSANDPLSAGTHTFKVVCDYNNEVSESNEGNNEYSRRFTITKSPPGPEISSINPYKGSAGTGTQVTITGEGFGATAGSGKVEFWYGRGNPGDPDRIEAPIVSWSDTQIVCEVPAVILNDYRASAGSGPLRVVMDEGRVSNEVTFIVTFSYMGVMWDNLYSNPEVPYRINENTSDCTGEGASVRAAAKTWNNAAAAFSFRYAGTHNNIETGQNGYNDIMWSNSVSTGVLAYATCFLDGGIITEADIAFNDKDCQWRSGNNPGSNEFDIQSILIHELGHWLSLRDLYGDIGDGVNDVGKVMYGRGGSGEIKRNLHSSDIAGIRWIYGASYPPAMPWIPLLLFED